MSKTGKSKLYALTERRLTEVLAGLPSRDLFKLFGGTSTSHPSELKQGYLRLAKQFHPNNYKGYPTRVIKLSKKILKYLNESYDMLKEETKRRRYRAAIEIGTEAEIKRAEATFNKGLRYLNEQRYPDARKTFAKLLKMRCAPADTMVHYIWAFLRDYWDEIDKSQYGRVLRLYDKIPAEAQFTAAHLFTMGLYCKLVGDRVEAIRFFRRALLMDPKLGEAKAELKELKER